VVLSPALTPPKGATELARTLGVELADDGFFVVNGVASSRPGILILGGASGPKDIRETVVEALAAAGGACKAVMEGEDGK